MSQPPNAPHDLLGQRGLPADERSEKMCLGAIQLNGALFDNVASILQPSDFTLESHRIIFSTMTALRAKEQPIDRVTLATEIKNNGKIAAVGGLTYLSELDEGMPQIPHPEAYAKSVAEKSKLRQLIFTAQKTIDRALMQDTAAAEIAEQASNQIVAIGLQGGEGLGGHTPTEILENYPGGVSSFLQPELRPKGLPTGFKRFDEMVGGFHKGEVYMIAARPAMGKSAILLNICEHLTLAEELRKNVALFSLEMTDASLLTRMTCARARVDATRFRLGYLDKEERYRIQVAVSELQEAKLRIYDQANPTLGEITKESRRLKETEGLDLLSLDYIQLLGQRHVESRHQELGQISRGLKVLAKELDIPVLILSQLSRITDRRGGSSRPQLSDLRESGNLEEDASVVAFLYRPEVYQPEREDLKGVAELIVSKSRHGATGIIPLVFVGKFTRFENRIDL